MNRARAYAIAQALHRRLGVAVQIRSHGRGQYGFEFDDREIEILLKALEVKL